MLRRALYLLYNIYLYNFIYNKWDIKLLGYKHLYAKLYNYRLYIKELVLRALYTRTFS
jgi:hypothetical protein